MKTGRNDPCLCGSGTKFKKCCGAVEGPAPNAPEPTPRSLSARGIFKVNFYGGDGDECRAADLITALLDQKKLPLLMATKLKGLPGDCHSVVEALSQDLNAAGVADGWTWCAGWISSVHGPVFHSWLECDGWVVEATTHPYRANDVTIMRADQYRETLQASRYASAKIIQNPTARWLLDHPAFPHNLLSKHQE